MTDSKEGILNSMTYFKHIRNEKDWISYSILQMSASEMIMNYVQHNPRPLILMAFNQI